MVCHISKALCSNLNTCVPRKLQCQLFKQLREEGRQILGKIEILPVELVYFYDCRFLLS